jgi:hypothetical protein
MTLRIEKYESGNGTIFKLVGRMRSENLEELRAAVDASGTQIVFDLDGVTLVDVDAIRFLSGCETRGIEVTGCSLYIREWIRRENEETRP